MNAPELQAKMRGDALISAGERFDASPGLLSRMIAPGFTAMVDRVDQGLERGSMLAHLPDGTSRLLGGRAPGFDAEMTLKDWRSLLRLATGGSIGWYQGYEAGEWECDDLTTVFAVMGDNARALGSTARSSGPFKWAASAAHWLNRNNRRGSARNIAAHYDLGNDFYAAWLDPGMTYSSGLGLADDGLEAAQARKNAAILERLQLQSGASAAEIGCGWGALAFELDKQAAHTTAISLSDEQLNWARRRDCNVNWQRLDYRDLDGQFDGIASVEMVEALGRENWPHFLDCVARNLKPGGRAAIQYISMADDLFETYAGTVDFIQAYIFPGGLLIKSSEFRSLAEERGLLWRDETGFGADYAATLRRWRSRFDRAAAQGALPQGFDERFVRLWRYYLAYCEAGFETGNVGVHQVTLVKE